jgi:hypothetical protein
MVMGYMVYVKRSGNNMNRTEKFMVGIRRVLLVVIFQILTLFGYSTVYYVSSSSGNDGNSGTSESSAWRSLSKVNSFTPKPGDEILFKRGDEWVGTINIKTSGTSGNPIVYGAYSSGEKPKIYGSERITGWTWHSGNIWKAQVSSNINQLFVNGKRIQNARYPKKGYKYIDKVNSSTSVTCNDLSGISDYSGAKIHVRTVQWRLITRDVISSSSTTLRVNSAPSYGFAEGKAFFLNNHLNFLTQPGEWHYDESTRTVYLWTPNGDAPSNFEVRGSTVDNGIRLENEDYITIKGLSLVQSKNNALHSNYGNYLTIDNLTAENPGWIGFYITNSQNLKVSNNYIRGALSDGMYLSNESLNWAGETVEIIDNEIRDVAVFDEVSIDGLGLCNGIFVRIKNALVKYNRIINNGYNAIQFYGQNSRIENNFIDGYCKTLNDGGGIYTWVGESSDRPLPVNSRGSKVLSNIIINGNDDGTGYMEVHNNQSGVRGIFTDLATQGVLIEGNTIAKSSAQGIFYNQNADVISRNNTLFDNPKGFRYTHNSIYGEGNEFSGNIVCNIETTTDWYNTTPLPSILIGVSKSGSDAISLDNNIYIDRHRTNVFSRLDTYQKLSFQDWQMVMEDDNNSTYIGKSLSYGETEKLFFNSSKESVTYNVNNAKARDIYGNTISSSFTLKPFTSKIVIGSDLSKITESSNNSLDAVVPTITSFSVLPTAGSLTVSVTSFSATDNIAVTGYKLTESSSVPNPDEAGWSVVPLTWYTFSSGGSKVLYAWAKDEAGNVSQNKNVLINLTSESESGVTGNSEVFPSVTTIGNRRAIPVIVNESGKIESISIYHNGGNGNMFLGVYSDQNGTPATLLGKTNSTEVNSDEGWQTISLSAPVTVSFGQTVWLSWVFESNPGIRFAVGQPGRAESPEDWSSGMPSAFGTSNLLDYTYSIFCSITPITELDKSIAGNGDVFTSSTSMNNRRAVPVTVNESGILESISIYHNGGSGNMLLGAYADQNGSPASLLGMTSVAAVNSSEGWQTVHLQNPVIVSLGQTVWLSWVFENNPGIRFTIGKPGRAESSGLWSSGMPSSFGPANYADYNYSVYGTIVGSGEYVTNTAGTMEVYGSITTAGNRRAIPVTFYESGLIESISIYHNGGNDNMLLGVYTDVNGTPGSILGATPSTGISSDEGWQTVSLKNPVPVTSGQSVWLSWVFENNPGVRYKSGQPYRAESSETWSVGMPPTFGSVNFVGYTYSVYCTYRAEKTSLKGATITETASKSNTLDEEEKPLFGMNKNDIIVYPNPAQSFVQVEIPDLGDLETKIRIIDNSGRIIVEKLIQSHTTRIDINHVSPGMYFVKMENSEVNLTKKLIVTRSY